MPASAPRPPGRGSALIPRVAVNVPGGMGAVWSHVMARRQKRVRLNPNSRQCKSLYIRNGPTKRRRKSARPVSSHKTPFEPFADVLKSIGFRSYADYLSSLLWATVRRQAFERWGSKCRACGKEATQVHHADYSRGTLRGDTLDHLWPVCNACHQASHDGAATIGEATARLRDRWQKRLRGGGERGSG